LVPELEDFVLKAGMAKVLKEPFELSKDMLPIGLSQGDHDDPEVVFV